MCEIRERAHTDRSPVCFCWVYEPQLTPFLSRGIAISGLAMSPGGLLRETRPNLATLSFLNADFLTVSPRAVTLLLTNRAAAPASLALRRENSLRKRTI